MIWVAWRQYRWQFLAAFLLLLALAALVVITGIHVRDSFYANPSMMQDILGPVVLSVPAVLGMFWGAPLLAREFETGTYRLIWTQSIGRHDWVRAKVLVVGAGALLFAAAVAALADWWYAPVDALDLNRLDPSVFTERGIVAVGYAAFAFSLGVAAGAVLRRVVPAMAATLLVYAGVRGAFTLWVRAHLLADSHVVLAYIGGERLPNAWTLAAPLRADRSALSNAQFRALYLRTCRLTGLSHEACHPSRRISGHVIVRYVTYQPASHFWPLQILETALFLLAGLAIAWVTIRWYAPRPGRRPAARAQPALQLLPGGPARGGEQVDVEMAPIPGDT